MKKLPAKMDVFRTKNTVLECFVNSEDCIPKWYKNGNLITVNSTYYFKFNEKIKKKKQVVVVRIDCGDQNVLNDKKVLDCFFILNLLLQMIPIILRQYIPSIVNNCEY